jgi:hypothetical protein
MRRGNKARACLERKSTYNDAKLVALGTHTGREKKLESLDVDGRAGKGFELLDGRPVAHGAQGVVLGVLVIQPVGRAAQICGGGGE